MKRQQRDLVIVLSAACVLMFSMSAVAADTVLEEDFTGVASVNIQVYKKWIGAAGDEGNSEIHLRCGSHKQFEPRLINTDRTEGWDVPDVPANGVFCSVQEIEQETFIADVTDCQELLLVPGQEVECTIVNTKVVKRIDMLNRYGLIIMISVMLGAGLAAVRRFAPM
jgi:hypothetical protein